LNLIYRRDGSYPWFWDGCVMMLSVSRLERMDFLFVSSRSLFWCWRFMSFWSSHAVVSWSSQGEVVCVCGWALKRWCWDLVYNPSADFLASSAIVFVYFASSLRSCSVSFQLFCLRLLTDKLLPRPRKNNANANANCNAKRLWRMEKINISWRKVGIFLPYTQKVDVRLDFLGMLAWHSLFDEEGRLRLSLDTCIVRDTTTIWLFAKCWCRLLCIEWNERKHACTIHHHVHVSRSQPVCEANQQARCVLTQFDRTWLSEVVDRVANRDGSFVKLMSCNRRCCSSRKRLIACL
jgi:hypothetical protein